VTPAAVEWGRVEALYREHHGDLLRAIRRQFTYEVAEDACAAAWLTAALKAPPDCTFGWLYVVALNEGRRLIRGRLRGLDKGAQDALPDAAGRSPADIAERREAVRAALRAVADLPDSKRPAFVSCMVGFSYAEAAREHDFTYTKVNRSVTEGRAAVREAVAT
jgi:DNA-directed RNA polymerase specialized sigma24 family protein